MKFVNLLIAGVLCMFGPLADAQNIQQDSTSAHIAYVAPNFENRGMAYSISYQSEHLEGVRYRSLPITACYKFNSKVSVGALIKPSVISNPERISEVHYFTVDEHGNHVFDTDRHVTREKENYLSIPLALMVRADLTGNRRNSPYLEVAFGHDLTQKSIYFHYMVGGRFGFGADNGKALLIGGGLVFHNPELYHNFDFGARFGVRIGFEF